MLQAAGYQTAIFGKWHLKTAPTGFDAWEVLPGQGAYYNPDMRVGPDDTRRQHEGYTTDIVTDLSLEWLKERRDSDKPFMLMSQHKAPHRNWMPGPEYLSLYDGQHIWEPPTPLRRLFRPGLARGREPHGDRPPHGAGPRPENQSAT